jgi:hypothetical protein
MFLTLVIVYPVVAALQMSIIAAASARDGTPMLGFVALSLLGSLAVIGVIPVASSL